MRLDPITLKVIRHRRVTIESRHLLLPIPARPALISCRAAASCCSRMCRQHLHAARRRFQELLSSHSELDPPLPIPNRAVKRLSADDSADYPCESRTLLGSLSRQAPVSQDAGAFAFVAGDSRTSSVFRRDPQRQFPGLGRGPPRAAFCVRLLQYIPIEV